jgi:glucosamine 6-phosphate synthetase-like amidotransferase/phosphosugar isomerase protein
LVLGRRIFYRFPPFIEYTSNAVYLEDGEMAVIRLHKSMSVRKIKDDSVVTPYSRAENEFGAN